MIHARPAFRASRAARKGAERTPLLNLHTMHP